MICVECYPVKLNEISIMEDLTIYSDSVNKIKKKKKRCMHLCRYWDRKNHESLYHRENKYLEHPQGKRSIDSAEVVEFSSV